MRYQGRIPDVNGIESGLIAWGQKLNIVDRVLQQCYEGIVLCQGS